MTKDLKKVNACIRRAKQDRDFAITLMPIPEGEMALFAHTDAALKNAHQKGSQAGFLIAAGEKKINEGEEGDWGLLGWKSGRLRRTVASSLAAETQAALNATRELHYYAALYLDLNLVHLDLENRT